MVGRMIRRVHMPEYNPSLLGGLNWEGGFFARSQYLTVVYMTFFPNDEIRKFFPGFDDTLSIQYHELKPINIVLSYTMPWPNTNNLTKYCVMYMDKDSVIELFLSFVLLFFKISFTLII